jgi:outer membrane protein OmpA-like peptidoglycan-associated protein
MAAVYCAALALAAVGAHAQQSPSEDQIINGLRPDAQSLRGPTRGIRPAGAPAPVRHGAEPAQEPAAGEAPSIDLTVNFVTGSAELTPGARHTLDTLGRALTSPSLAAFRFRIEGHTDTVGTEAENQKLSEQRAQSAARYLEDRFHIDPARLDSVGRGESDLAVATPPQTPNSRNRRVKIVNLGS